MLKVLVKSKIIRENFCRIWQKKLATKLMKKTGVSLEIGATTGSAAVSKHPQLASSIIPDVSNFYYTGKGIYLERFI